MLGFDLQAIEDRPSIGRRSQIQGDVLDVGWNILDRVPLNEILGPEDQGLCESVQRGLKSKSYNQGRFMVDPKRSGTAEQGVYQFHKLVMDALA